MKTRLFFTLQLLVIIALLGCSDDKPSSPYVPPTVPGQGRYFTLLDGTNSEIIPGLIRWIYAHDDGSVFVAANGVFVLKNGIVVDRYTEENSVLLSDEVLRIDGGGGVVWFMHADGFTYLQSGSLHRCDKVAQYLRDTTDTDGWILYLTAMAAEDDGCVCFTVLSHGLYRFDPNSDSLMVPDVDFRRQGEYSTYGRLWHANGITYFPTSWKGLLGYNIQTGQEFQVIWGGTTDHLNDIAFGADGSVYLPIFPAVSITKTVPVVVRWKDQHILSRDTINTDSYPDKRYATCFVNSLDVDTDGNIFMLLSFSYLDAIWSDGSFMDRAMLTEIFRSDFGGITTATTERQLVRCGKDGRLYIWSRAGLFISKQPIRP